MTNNNNNEENIHWEESTAHRDKHKDSFNYKAIKKGVQAINWAIRGCNKLAKLIPGFNGFKEMDVDQTVTNLAESGGSSTALGVVDHTVKLARWGVSKINKWNILTLVEKGLLGLELSIDSLKDLMTSTAISGLSAEVGDLKDGQAKLNSKVDAQGKLMNKRMGDLKAELQGDLKQQGEKFDKEIKDLDKRLETATGENRQAIENEKKERQAEYQELKNSINEVTENLNRVENKLTDALNDFKSEVNERFEEQEQKIIANKRKIEEERIKREEEIREVKDKIKLTTTNLENFRKDKEQIEDEFITYKSKINQQTAETQQAFEDTQADYERRTKIIEAQIEDNQETLEEFQEDLTNVRNEQAKQRIQQEEILEELQETNDILFAQQRKLNLVADQMNDMQEEFHERMDKTDDRINETLNIAKDTNKKLDKLTDEVQNIRQETERLQEQIKQNKADTEKAKKEAKLANERLDNLIKAQTLSDYSAQESKIDKIQKSLELKAEEAKLLATLNLLTETKKLIPKEPAEREWKVGVKTGTAPKNFPEPEGFTLDHNNHWVRKYTGDQVKVNNPHDLFTQEWFNWEQKNQLPPEETKFEPWGTRVKSEHESAPLTKKDQRKEQQVEPTKQEKRPAAGTETKQSDQILEELEQIKSETLQQLATIQQQINQQLDEAEEEPLITKTKLSAKYTPQIKKTQQRIKQLQKNPLSQTQKSQLFKQKQELKAEISKEQEQVKKIEKSLSNSAVSAQSKQTLQCSQEQKEEKLTELQKQLAKVESQDLDQAQSELQNLQSQQDFEQDLEKQEEELRETEKKEIEQQWTTIQALSQQSLQEPKDQPKPEETKEEDLNKKLEELVQQLQEMEQSAAASQKTMTMFMLFLIIFLLEYVVYKRNGLPGLVILNVILAVCYYHRETLKEYSELWGKYLLIIGYIMGNVLAYSAPEQEKYKWPSVIGFNLIIFGIYAYTLWQKNQEQAKIEAHYQTKVKEIYQEENITDEEWQGIQQSSQSPVGMSGIVDEYSVFSGYGNEIKTEQLENLKTVIQQKEETIKQEEYLKKQTETLEQAAEIEKKLAEARNGLGTAAMSWNKIYEKYPDFKTNH